ncbi:MAG: tetratricopeptide repeat protein [Ferruginibacter sp.]|nr:tetratricopeptide repeat protein [Ferruginibacter sp.]
MRFIFSFIFLLWGFINTVCGQDVKELQETARAFMRQGDFSNAIIVLNRAYGLNPNNTLIAQDLALAYYYQHDLDRAEKLMKPLVDKGDTGDQGYQILANILLSRNNQKEAEKIYKKGLKKYPQSGPLYNDYGELLWQRQDYSAISMWEKGILEDPNFAPNYYNASKYYYFSTNKVWGLLYGEIFLNIDPQSKNAPEVKELILNGYKKLFTETDLDKVSTNNKFEKAFLATMAKQSSPVSLGISPDVLTMVRTRFLLDWENDDNKLKTFPFHLFEVQKQFLKEGLFEAYNQWLFGSTYNLAGFQTWVELHKDEYDTFLKKMRTGVFKMPVGQYYK